MSSSKHGTTTSAEPARAEKIRISENHLFATLEDGRVIRVPLSFYPTLRKASIAQRRKRRPIGKGVGYHWEDLDFDLSIEGMLRGERERRPKKANRRKSTRNR